MSTPRNPVVAQMLAHRSIRAYTDEPVAPEDLREAVRAGQAAATSSAVQAYCCIRVTDPAARREIADLAGPQRKIVHAPEFLVICADSRRHRLLCRREGLAYDQRFEAFLVGVIDATLFAQNMVLALESMGYGTCYIGGLRNDLARVDRALQLPEGVYPVYALCVGRPAQAPAPRPRLPVDAVLFDGAYPSDDDLLGRLSEYDDAYRAYLEERGAPAAQAGAGWSGAMAGKHATPTREDLARYYAAKGARLD